MAPCLSFLMTQFTVLFPFGWPPIPLKKTAGNNKNVGLGDCRKRTSFRVLGVEMGHGSEGAS